MTAWPPLKPFVPTKIWVLLFNRELTCMICEESEGEANVLFSPVTWPTAIAAPPEELERVIHPVSLPLLSTSSVTKYEFPLVSPLIPPFATLVSAWKTTSSPVEKLFSPT